MSIATLASVWWLLLLRWWEIWSERTHSPCKFSFNYCYVEFSYKIKPVFTGTDCSFSVSFIAWHGLCKFHRRLTKCSLNWRVRHVQKSLSFYFAIADYRLSTFCRKLPQLAITGNVQFNFTVFNTTLAFKTEVIASFLFVFIAEAKSKIFRTSVLL